MNILIAYDGTIHARKALKYGIEKVKGAGTGTVTVLQVFDSSLFVDYDAGVRAEELARSEAARQLDEAKRIASEFAEGIPVAFIIEEGKALELIASHAAELRPDLVLVTPRYKVLAASLSRPVTVIPGTVLVPVDTAFVEGSNIDGIVREATATGSRVLLLGIVPVHLYSREEKKELERVKKVTTAAMKQLKKMLAEKGIEAAELLRSGYPDEEILKAANEQAVSLILLPSGGTTPSELSKAAAILLDESERLKWPVFLLPPAIV
jgi:nucleotide-binding universal stress UspA family protein